MIRDWNNGRVGSCVVRVQKNTGIADLENIWYSRADGQTSLERVCPWRLTAWQRSSLRLCNIQSGAGRKAPHRRCHAPDTPLWSCRHCGNLPKGAPGPGPESLPHPPGCFQHRLLIKLNILPVGKEAIFAGSGFIISQQTVKDELGAERLFIGNW